MDCKTTITEELVRLFKRVDYCSTVRLLKEIETVMINEYEKLEISQWYELDTTHCFLGKKKPKFNTHCIYNIFAGYCDLDKFQLKEKVTAEVAENKEWYDRLCRVYFSWKDIDLNQWLKKQKYKNNSPDELCIYALSVLFRRHTIIYTTYQPWCTIDIKPGMRPETVEEACETKLVYLGGTLFGELRRKPLTITSWPQVNIDEIQSARILHRDANLMEMYIEHATSSELNVSNVNVVRNVQTFLSPSDTTRILPANPTVFDPDYLSDSKIEPDVLDQNTMFMVTESMGSHLGEITFPSVIKDEPDETLVEGLTTHLPSCQLRCGFEQQLQTLLGTHSGSSAEPEPSQTMEYSSDETIILTPTRPGSQNQKASPLLSQEVTTCSPDATVSTSTSIENAPNPGGIIYSDSQELTNMDLEDADNYSESLTSPEQQLTFSTTTLDAKTELGDVETLSTSVPSLSRSSHIIGEPTSELTVVEPEHHDDIVCAMDSITTANEPDSTQDEYQNLWSRSKDTLASDTSIVNISMEICDSVQITPEQRGISQDVSSQQLSSQDITASQDKTSHLQVDANSQLSPLEITDQPNVCQATRCSQDVSVSRDTLYSDGSIVNISMEALAGDSTPITPDQHDSLQDVSSQQFCSHDITPSQEETPRLQIYVNPQLSSHETTHQPNMCHPTSTELSQDVPVLQSVTPPSTCEESSDFSPPDLTCEKVLSDSVSQDVTIPYGEPVGEVINPVTGPLVSNTELNIPPHGSPPVTLESVMHDRSLDHTKDGAVSPASSISVFTVTRSNAEKAKKRLTAFGLSEEVYHANLSTYYPLVSVDDDLDFINFTGIVNSNCSVSLDNLSVDDIKFEQKQLKASSPVQSDRGGTDTGTSTVNTPSDNEKNDPTYGTPKQEKISHRPRRKPSSNRIAAQLIINKSRKKRGLKTEKQEFYPCKPSQSYENKKVGAKPASGKKSDITPPKRAQSSKTSKSGVTSKNSGKSKSSGLKIVHHGLKRQTVKAKGRHCQCEMCGKRFDNSTAFIAHYSSTHPPLPCTDCDKIFSNPLSLQKHRYHHVGKKYPCTVCDRTFPFNSQLQDHRKSHFKTKPHMCSFPNCGKEATHLYDLKKHERTH